MAGVDVFELALFIEHAEEHGGVAAHLGMAAEKTIEVVEDAHRVGTQAHTGQNALQHSGEQGRAEALAGNVGNQKSSAIVAEREDVEIISAHRKAGKIAGGYGEVRVIAEVAGQQGLLDVPRNIDFLLEALAFTFASHQARVIENAGGLIGESVEKLAVKSGKGRGAARIEIEHPEE